MRVQIRFARSAVPVGERGGDQPTDINLPDALWPGPGEQGMRLDEPQRVVHGGTVGPFDHSRNCWFGDRP
jgi:hypothetical protein